ncbi:MAG: T9SS type A sorting domain-containing protein [Bacteroidales bacterium]|nr:T9SS type A sorting domain-containing protein [Bacteroidales bacterium]
MKRLSLVIVFGLLLISLGFAQTQTIRMMHYNLLFYTEQGSGGCNSSTNNLNTKDAALRTIIDYVEPDVFVVNEIGSNVSYADRIVNNVLNTNGRQGYQHGPLTNYSGGNIANMLFYNSAKLAFHSHFSLNTVNRDINGYKMYYITPNLSHGDTVFTTFILMHLKAGTGSDNEQKRLSQVTRLMNYLESTGLYGNICLSGDFNIYGASEDAYQHLIHYSNSLYKFYDPINMEAEWNNSYDSRYVHTQSTHSDDNGCASPGGLDDRFDFILVSSPVYYGSRKVSIVDGSYKALGNDGNHFNKSINYSTNQAVPSSVANALYNMSDHLPVIMDLAIDVSPVSVSAPSIADFEVYAINPVEDHLKISILPSGEEDMLIELYSLEGKLLMSKRQRVGSDGVRMELDFPYSSGLYILKITDSHNATVIKKIVK